MQILLLLSVTLLSLSDTVYDQVTSLKHILVAAFCDMVSFDIVVDVSSTKHSKRPCTVIPNATPVTAQSSEQFQ